MSQRKHKKNNRDSEDGMSTAGKVVLGVAVAAAGAAIGYLGSRLLDGWLSNSEEEKGAAAAPVSTPSKPKVVDDSDDESFNVCSRPAANEWRSPSAGLQHPVSLHQQLLNYYDSYVEIPRRLMENTEHIVDKLRMVVNSNLRQAKLFNSPLLKIGELVMFGSITEGLTVIRPDCFDVMIPIKFEAGCVAKDFGVCSGSVFLNLELKSSALPASDYDVVCDTEHNVIPGKLLESFKHVVQRAISSCNSISYDAELSVGATALNLVLKPTSGDKILMNFVPAVIVDNELFIPKSHGSQSTQSDVNKTLWNVSYSRQEKWAIDRFDSSVCGHQMTLKILKAIRLNHPEQFGPITSYDCKMVLFHVLEDLPDSCDWSKDVVGERLIDVLTRLKEALTEHSLPHYFEQNTNLLELIPQEACFNLAKFLEKKLAYNDLGSMLKKEY